MMSQVTSTTLGSSASASASALVNRGCATPSEGGAVTIRPNPGRLFEDLFGLAQLEFLGYIP
jgi:hypothetical protein